ncbi:hypothetical protein V8C37DRAFT_390354 [Trichoderma ceciliae]
MRKALVLLLAVLERRQASNLPSLNHLPQYAANKGGQLPYSTYDNSLYKQTNSNLLRNAQNRPPLWLNMVRHLQGSQEGAGQSVSTTRPNEETSSKRTPRG